MNMLKTKSMTWLDILATTIIIVGALAWFSIGAFNYDIVAKIFGYMSFWTRTIETIVGIAGIYAIIRFIARK